MRAILGNEREFRTYLFAKSLTVVCKMACPKRSLRSEGWGKSVRTRFELKSCTVYPVESTKAKPLSNVWIAKG